MDPMGVLFGEDALSLYRSPRFRVAHGAYERLPAWMREGPLSSIEALCSAYRGRLEIAHGGMRAAQPEENGFIGSGGQTPVSGASAFALLRLGLTVYFPELGDTVAASKAYLTSLEAALGLPRCSVVGAFANAPGSGLVLHHDSHDQLLIQLRGDKVIEVAPDRDAEHPGLPHSPSGPTATGYESVYRNGVRSEAEIEAQLQRIELCPGSCLFMPAGTWHRTADQAEPCLSLVVVVRAPSRLDLAMTALTLHAQTSAAWRAPAYGMMSAEGLSDLPEAFDDLAARLPQLDGEALRDAWLVRGVVSGRADDYPPGVTFRRYLRLPGTRYSVDSSGAGRVRVRIEAAGMTGRPTTLEFGDEALAILEHVALRRQAFAAADVALAFTDFEAEEVGSFLMQLCRAGLLRPVPTSADG